MAHDSFSPKPRLCSRCYHWSTIRVVNEDGYLEAMCTEPPDDRDRKLKRGSDTCSKWKQDHWKPLKTPAEYNI